MRQRDLAIRSAAFTFMAALFGCSDDATTESSFDAGQDGTVKDAQPQPQAESGPLTPDASLPDSSSPIVDAGSDTSQPADASGDARSADAARDSGIADAARDAPGDAVATDGGSPLDAAAEAGADGGGADSGATCPANPVYFEDLFSVNPTQWHPVAGTWAWDQPDSGNLGQGVYWAAEGDPNAVTWIGARPSWTDYSVSLRMRMDSGSGNGGLTFRMQADGVPEGGTTAPNDSGKMYYVGLSTGGVAVGYMNDDYFVVGSKDGTFAQGTWYTLRVDVKGTGATGMAVTVDGVDYGSYPASEYAFGSVGIRTYQMGISVDSIRVECR